MAVRKLLEKGADVNARQVILRSSRRSFVRYSPQIPGDGGAPLHLAINRGHERVISVLLEAEDIDVNARLCIITHEEEKEETLLHAAVRADNEMAVRKLLAKGADVNAKRVMLRSPRKSFVRYSPQRPGDGDTPLHLAINIGHEHVALVLLEAEKIDVNARCRINNEKEETLLHAAVRANSEVIVRKLLAKGADVNARQVMLRSSRKFFVRYSPQSPGNGEC